MKVPENFTTKKNVIIESIILIAFLIGGYYLYGMLTATDAQTTEVAVNEQLLGQNLVLFLKSKSQDPLSFKDISFINSQLVKSLEDNTEIINPTQIRGRMDPFVPYALTRPLR
jgi:hypothetical protein